MKITGHAMNLARVLDKADAIDRESGIFSYQKYNLIMGRIAEKFGYSIETVTAVFVSLSPNNDYMNNLRSAVTLIDGHSKKISKYRLSVSAFNHCKERAWNFLEGANFLEETKGPKIKSFYQNIVDPTNPEPVTVDGHIVSAWHGKHIGMKAAAVGNFPYKEIAADIRALAALMRLVPCQVQGIIWFTWKRINKVVYNSNLDLFGDHWGLDRDPREMKPFPLRPIQ